MKYYYQFIISLTASTKTSLYRYRVGAVVPTLTHSISPHLVPSLALPLPSPALTHHSPLLSPLTLHSLLTSLRHTILQPSHPFLTITLTPLLHPSPPLTHHPSSYRYYESPASYNQGVANANPSLDLYLTPFLAPALTLCSPLP